MLAATCIIYKKCVCIISTDVLLSKILPYCLRLAALNEFLVTADCQAARPVVMLNDLSTRSTKTHFLLNLLVVDVLWGACVAVRYIHILNGDNNLLS